MGRYDKDYPLETTLQINAIKILEAMYKEDIYIINVHGGGRQKKGIPDLLILLKGKYIAIELKVGDNEATEKQEYEMECIENAGGYVGVAWTIQDVIDIIENALE